MTKIIPFVTIIVPCRNEEKYIVHVLDNICKQDYPAERMEVYVVDGASTDKTVHLVQDYILNHSSIHLLNNPYQIVPHALNIAIQQCKGDVIVRMDAHAVYPEIYVSRLVNALDEYKADNTGGVWITEPGADTPFAKAIAMAMAHPFGIGNASYRLGADKPTLTDTVPFGCYRREVFQRIGFFDEQLIRNQDDEFNGRLIKNGGRIMLIPDVKIRYYARETVGKMARMFYQYGLFKPLVNIKLGKPATLRQLFPPALLSVILAFLIAGFFNSIFLLFLVIVCLFYLAMDLYFSIVLGFKGNLILKLILIFPAIHFSYGWGYLRGIFLFVFLRKHIKQQQMSTNITR